MIIITAIAIASPWRKSPEVQVINQRRSTLTVLRFFPMRNLLRHMIDLPRNAIVLLITLYQHTLSPDHGPLKHLHTYGYCRHSPTCSQYTKEQILNRGLVVGTFLGCKQLLTCHPFATISDAKMRTMVEQQNQRSTNNSIPPTQQ